MAVSRNSEQRQSSNVLEWFTRRVSRYDLLLAVIPVVLGLALTVGLLTGVPSHLAVLSGALFCAVLVADAVYFNPPTKHSSRYSRD